MLPAAALEPPAAIVGDPACPKAPANPDAPALETELFPPDPPLPELPAILGCPALPCGRLLSFVFTDEPPPEHAANPSNGASTQNQFNELRARGDIAIEAA